MKNFMQPSPLPHLSTTCDLNTRSDGEGDGEGGGGIRLRGDLFRPCASPASAVPLLAPRYISPVGYPLPEALPLSFFSASSFLRMTSMQKKEAFQYSFLSVITLIIAERERSGPIDPTNTARWSAQAGQNSSVCWAVLAGSSQWWHCAVRSFPMRHRYEPKHPLPVITCVAWKVSPPHLRSTHRSKMGRMAWTTRRPGMFGAANYFSILRRLVVAAGF